MRRGRIITGTITSVAAGLIAVSSAFAATPGEIAKDLADGQLNGTYTKQELQDYLKNATTQGYPPGPENPQAPADEQTSAVAGVQTPPSSFGSSESPAAGVAGQQSPLDETAQIGSLPFTGLDLGFLVLGGVLLLAIGLGARRAGSRA